MLIMYDISFIMYDQCWSWPLSWSLLDKASGFSSKVEGEMTLDELVNRSGMNEADGPASHEATIEAMEQQGKEVWNLFVV